jgi:parallel beta-helix repeat protein
VVNCEDVGIFIKAASNVLVKGNEVSNGTLRGIWLQYCFSTIVVDNKIYNIVGNKTVLGNIYGAIDLEISAKSIIVNNSLENSISGLYFDINATDTKIYHNNFINNTEPVINIGGENTTWDNGYPSGGNYWSNYLTKYPNATAIDNTGIGNTPYVIDQWDKDIYPLMKPYPISA